ncbi:MAG: glycosyltransferase family 1 protein [Actinobacteria bacterium]|nr:glycosyltransferase family 1 protein [Actinomycetota bacterium]
MFAGLAEGTGQEFEGTPGRSVRDLVESEEGQALLRHVRNPLAIGRRLNALIAPDLEHYYETTLAAAEGADAMLCFPATFPALDVATALGLPVVQVHHVPAVPTATAPAPVSYVGARTLGPLGNRLSYTADVLMTWRLTRDAVDGVRRRVLGRAPRTARQTLTQWRRRVGALVGVSPSVLPRPSDWPGDVVTCGFWWPGGVNDQAPPLDAETLRFLDAGPAPVFLGLGSTPLDDPAAVTEIVTGAARDAGVRLVLQRGWAGLGAGAESETVHVVGDLPYTALFDHVAAVVHHGGAGTMALGLRHGKPTLALPALADQFFWGHRVKSLEAGPAPLPVKRLSRAALAERLTALTTTTRYAERARALAEAMRQEDGEAAAAAALERFFGSHSRPQIPRSMVV